MQSGFMASSLVPSTWSTCPARPPSIAMPLVSHYFSLRFIFIIYRHLSVCNTSCSIFLQYGYYEKHLLSMDQVWNKKIDNCSKLVTYITWKNIILILNKRLTQSMSLFLVVGFHEELIRTYFKHHKREIVVEIVLYFMNKTVSPRRVK